MTDAVTKPNSAVPTGFKSLLTTEGREARPFKVRVTAAISVIVALHVIGLGLLAVNVLTAQAGAVTIGVAGLAYFRGLVHSFDFDHISMIDNSTRKFVAEGRRPASVGLAFSTGHATVVILTGILAVSGAGVIKVALDENSRAAQTLGIVGLAVSGLYMMLVALANLGAFLAAFKLRRQLQVNPQLEVTREDLTPRGPAARIMAAPLRRVKHPRHIYVVGFLFSLGFDTSSQIGLLVLTGVAAVAGAPLVSLLALPFLFAAAMTMGDTANGLMMLKMYETANDNPARKINFNLLITGVSILSALIVGTLAAATLLTEEAGVRVGLVESLASLDTQYAGYLLAALFAVIGLVAYSLWRRSARSSATGV
jgi:high-affinity nickel-transport protein